MMSLVMVVALFLSACRNQETAAPPPARPDPAAVALEQRLSNPAPDGVAANIWDEAKRFYTARTNTLAWISAEDAHRGADALAMVEAAREHGLDPAKYQVDALAHQLASRSATEPASDRDARNADLDARITALLLTYGHDIALGVTTPTRVSSLWKSQHTAPDFIGALQRASSGEVSTFTTSVQPPHAQYAALVAYTRSLLDAQAKGERRAGGSTIDERLRQVALNLERWRWMPDTFGPRYVLVNIPALHLYVQDGDHTVRDMNVIVGKADGHETPVFSGQMSTVVFSPWWNIPYGIGQNETAISAGNNPAYLTDHKIDVYRNGKLQNEGEINWFDPKDLKGLTFRQAPGATNALGRVKFLFPNQFDVYLHDTPDDSPFGEALRALSHGCVRVADPEGLAQYVLRDDPAWTPAKIAQAMSSGRERHVKLTTPLPVHLVYFTAWAKDNGSVEFLPDIYGYDTRQARIKTPTR
jgi:murein L,D-transpeptidase YcbB/YkuD